MPIHEAADSRHRYASAFARMFWAFPFIGLSLGLTFNFGGFGKDRFTVDLLPDFVGYLLITSGANRLLGLHPGARGVRNLALVLTYMAIPGIVQYQVDLSKGVGPHPWLVAASAWGLLVAILDMALIWSLCGLVADLARVAHDPILERRARSRRGAYVALKVVGGLGVAVAFSRPELVLPLAIATGLVGLTVVALMMGLMGRAARIGSSEMAPDTLGSEALDGPSSPTSPGLLIRLASAGGVMIPLLLVGGFAWYYQDWSAARRELDADNRSSQEEQEVASRFLRAIEAGDFDAAYRLTTTGLRGRLSRARLEEMVRRRPAILHRRDSQGSGAGAGSGHDECYSYVTLSDADGAETMYLVRVRRHDNVFHRRPPAPGVDDFTVETVSPGVPDTPWNRSRLRHPGGG